LAACLPKKNQFEFTCQTCAALPCSRESHLQLTPLRRHRTNTI
jgi:hypothetical protein